VGLGLRPNEQFSGTLEDWINEQLNQNQEWKILRTTQSKNRDLITWPSNIDLTLDARIKMLRKRRANSVAIDKQKLNDGDRYVKQEENFLENSISRYDQSLFLQTAVYSSDQIRIRLSHFWLNHFTIGSTNGTPELIGDFWKNVIYNRLDGSFSEMLYFATTHPAMLVYLDNIHNIGPHSIKSRDCITSECVVGLNDNLGRELLELHTVSPQRGYTEIDIHETAKVLCGWGDLFDQPFMKEPKDFNQPWENYHAEPGEKIVLGNKIPEGQSGLRVLTDQLAKDEFTAHHLAMKLVHHFIGEAASISDINSLAAVWLESNGNLPTVHREVLRMASVSKTKRFHWPLTWAIQVLRISNTDFIEGIEDVDSKAKDDVQRSAEKIMIELGNSFWSERQPNGYSDAKADWLSTEHLDRRVRFAELVHAHGKNTLPVRTIVEKNRFSDYTISLVNKGKTEKQKFILLMCSPEFMEV
jgi:uncharacterized protein (DUF1800 family)